MGTMGFIFGTVAVIFLLLAWMVTVEVGRQIADSISQLLTVLP